MTAQASVGCAGCIRRPLLPPPLSPSPLPSLPLLPLLHLCRTYTSERTALAGLVCHMPQSAKIPRDLVRPVLGYPQRGGGAAESESESESETATHSCSAAALRSWHRQGRPAAAPDAALVAAPPAASAAATGSFRVTLDEQVVADTEPPWLRAVLMPRWTCVQIPHRRRLAARSSSSSSSGDADRTVVCSGAGAGSSWQVAATPPTRAACTACTASTASTAGTAGTDCDARVSETSETSYYSRITQLPFVRRCGGQVSGTGNGAFATDDCCKTCRTGMRPWLPPSMLPPMLPNGRGMLPRVKTRDCPPWSQTTIPRARTATLLS